MLALEQPAGGSATDLGAPLERIAELVRKRGMIVLITDLLAPIDRLESSLALLTATGHEVLVFQVLDPTEIDFSFEEASKFRDLETGRDLFLDPAQARAGYRKAFDAHRASVRGICERWESHWSSSCSTNRSNLRFITSSLAGRAGAE
jgi:uncharacterized protein (DUF58 family)